MIQLTDYELAYWNKFMSRVPFKDKPMRQETKDLIQKKTMKDGKIHSRDIRAIIDCETEELNKTIDRLRKENQKLNDILNTVA